MMLTRTMLVLIAALWPLQEDDRTPRRGPAQSEDPPVIAHVPVTRLRAGADLVIEATVTGPRKIARVSVAFHAGDRFGGAALEASGPSTYRGRVAASRLARTFSYIIHASDEKGRVATWPEPPARPVTVVVGEDARYSADPAGRLARR